MNTGGMVLISFGSRVEEVDLRDTISLFDHIQTSAQAVRVYDNDSGHEIHDASVITKNQNISIQWNLKHEALHKSIGAHTNTEDKELEPLIESYKQKGLEFASQLKHKNLNTPWVKRQWNENFDYYM